MPTIHCDVPNAPSLPTASQQLPRTHTTATAIPMAHIHTVFFSSQFFVLFCFVGVFLSAKDKNTQCKRRQHNSIHAGQPERHIERASGDGEESGEKNSLECFIATSSFLFFSSLALFYSFHCVRRVSCFDFSIETIQCIIYRKLQTDELCIKCFCSINSLSHSVSVSVSVRYLCVCVSEKYCIEC